MKLIREHIYEKFSEDSDPIEDMGIGIYHLCEEELKKLENMGLMNASFYLFDNKIGYAKETQLIISFLQKIIDRKNLSYQDAFNYEIKHYHGYHYTGPMYNKYEQLNAIKVIKEKFGINLTLSPEYLTEQKSSKVLEKFELDSDPIHDMGVGFDLKKFWKEQVDEIGCTLTYLNREKYFYKGPDESLKWFWGNCSQIMWQTIKAASAGKDPQIAFNGECKEYKIDKNTKNDIIRRKKIAQILKNQFYIEVDPNIKLKESLNEKFDEDSDPIKDMGIGLIAKLEKEYDILKDKETFNEMAGYLFNNKLCAHAAHVTKGIILLLLQRKDNINSETIEKELYGRSLSPYGRNIIRRYFRDKFDIENFNIENDGS